MKKISIAILLMLFTATAVYAEQSAQTYSGKRYEEQQVFVDAYNNSGSDISSNYVVIVETSATYIASGSTLGAYINTTSTANDNRAFGVTDEVIENGSTGRVCVRGPHKTYLTGLQGKSVGATLATCTTAGAGDMSSSTSKGGEFGILLSTTKIGNGESKVPAVADGFVLGEGNNNYWVWVGKR